MLRLLSIFLLTTLAGLAHPHEDLPVSQSDDARRTLADARSPTLLRGLPHPAKDPDSYQAALPKASRLGDFPFGKTKLPLAPDTADSLRQLLSDPTNLEVWTEKRCGGFHPDFALSWRKGLSKQHALICFTCGEIIYLTKDAQLRYNLTPAAATRLKALLPP